MDAKLERIRDLISQKEAIDTELESLIGGTPLKEPKTRVCSVCGKEGHTARTCPTKQEQTNG
jgi:hypothetical protein